MRRFLKRPNAGLKALFCIPLSQWIQSTFSTFTAPHSACAQLKDGMRDPCIAPSTIHIHVNLTSNLLLKQHHQH